MDTRLTLLSLLGAGPEYGYDLKNGLLTKKSSKTIQSPTLGEAKIA